MRETGPNGFYSRVIRRLEIDFPEAIVLRGNSEHLNGIPDIVIIHHDRWAALEVKRSYNASTRPNQKYYIDLLNNWSYASIIHPQNENEVFLELESALSPGRTTC